MRDAHPTEQPQHLSPGLDDLAGEIGAMVQAASAVSARVTQ
jgi:hypothetical protein